MEVVVRAAVVFVVLWAVTRAVGRTSVGELSTYQLIVFVVMGDLVQQAVTQQDYSVTGAVLAVSTMALLTIGLSWTSQRLRPVRRLTHGTPVVVVHRGEPLLDVMRTERVSLEELLQQARQRGLTRLGDVDTAVLEADGTVSFLQARDGRG